MVIVSGLVIVSDLLDISNPHEYADICYYVIVIVIVTLLNIETGG